MGRRERERRALAAERDIFAQALAFSELRGFDGLTPGLQQVVQDLTDDLVELDRRP